MLNQDQAIRILLIDDDDFARDLLVTVLGSIGFEDVQPAESGQVALSLIADAEVAFDIAICDLRMPDMDGLEFIRQLSTLAENPAIVIASAADPSVRKAAENVAASFGLNLLGALDKPVGRKELAELLRGYVEKPAARSPQRPQYENLPLSANDIREGLDAGALTMFFQPQISVTTHDIVGFEALARWRHPERGILGPGAFLPVVEEAGFMHEFTKLAIREALQSFVQWRDLEPDCKVSVNIAAQDLSDLTLPQYVVQAALDTDVPLQKVTLEITESGVTSDAVAAMEVLARLRLKDITLSVDDFGTGYASLDKLKDLPFTELKIDRTFVNGASHNKNARALLESAITLGKRLDLHLVAEGVETQEDWDLVASLECDTIQGYFVARPMPGEEVSAWVTQWRAGQRSAYAAKDAM